MTLERSRTTNKAVIAPQKAGAANIYGNLGELHRRQKKVAPALEFFRKSLEIKEQLGDRHGAAMTYLNLGYLYRDNINDHAEARKNFERAKALFEMVGDARNAQEVAQALREL